MFKKFLNSTWTPKSNEKEPPLKEVLNQIGTVLSAGFAVWVILISITAYCFPGFFLPVKPFIEPLLGIIMFGMGMTLRFEDFKTAFAKPAAILIGVILQFAIMPALGAGVALLLHLSPEIAAGMVLVGSCPGGTASNVMVYLSKGNVALSIAMTSVSTLLAPVLTPWLIYLYARQWLPVHPAALFITIMKIILIPVLLGLLVKRFLPKWAGKAAPFTPSISMLAIMTIIACIVALNGHHLKSMAAGILIAVIMHNGLGLTMGYWLAKLTGQNATNCRAIAIEVGMQNSGMGAVLAHSHFSPVTALPSAVFSIWHNISGAFLAGIWGRENMRDKRINQKEIR